MIIFTLDLFKERKRSTIGKIQNTFVRIIQSEDTEEVARYDFNNLGSNRKLVVCGVLKRKNAEWQFLPPQHETPNVNTMSNFIDTLLS